MPKPEDTQSDWLVIVPMVQLNISNDPPINGQWSVGDVTFHSRESLEAFLHPPNIRAELAENLKQRIVGAQTAYAVIRRTGIPTELRRQVFFELREAANILAATAAFYTKRHQASGFTLQGYPFQTAKFDAFLDLIGTSFCGNWNQRGMLMPVDLDANWHTAITATGINNLFSRIVDPAVPPDWRRQIASGAAMLGRSLMSLDLADAFLLDVIGLETLLTRRRERNGDRLARRVKGMTGWHLRVHRPAYEAEIRGIHGVRCEIVHDSDYSNLTTELLLQADMYLANSLLNIVNLPAVFPDKATLATTLDNFAINENWPMDNSIPFRWFGNSQFSPQDLQLDLW